MLLMKFEFIQPAGVWDIHAWKCERKDAPTDARADARTPAQVPSYARSIKRQLNKWNIPVSALLMDINFRPFVIILFNLHHFIGWK